MDKKTSNLLKKIKKGYESHKSALIFDIKKLMLTTLNLDYAYDVNVNFLHPIIIAETTKCSPSDLCLSYKTITGIEVDYPHDDGMANMHPEDVIEGAYAFVNNVNGDTYCRLDDLEIDNLYRISKALEELVKTCYNR